MKERKKTEKKREPDQELELELKSELHVSSLPSLLLELSLSPLTLKDVELLSLSLRFTPFLCLHRTLEKLF